MTVHDVPGRFRTFTGVVEIPLRLTAEGPLLIKGPAAFQPDLPDASFVRYPTEHGPVPYIPGSSLKGVLRSGAESLLAALGERVCDPLRLTKKDREEHDKALRQDPSLTGKPGFRTPACNDSHRRCQACLTFGSTEGASVLLVDDGLPWMPGAPSEDRVALLKELDRRSTVRTNVAINRQTGAADGRKLFDYEVITGASFHPVVRLRNPRPWQAALVAAALGLLDDGTLRLGSQTTKGLGRVRTAPETLVVRSLDDRRIGPLLQAAVFEQDTAPGLLRVHRAKDPADTLARWSGQLRSWLDQERS